MAPSPRVDADLISCAQRLAFAAEQEARVVHDALQLRKHVTRDEILPHYDNWIGPKAMLLRLRRTCEQ